MVSFFFESLKIKGPCGSTLGRGPGCQRSLWNPCAPQRCGTALYGEKDLWEVLFGCPFSLKHGMNLRWNSTGRTADASHTASTSYLSGSESHRHCQLVVSSMRACVGLTWPTAVQSNQARGSRASTLRRAALPITLFQPDG